MTTTVPGPARPLRVSGVPRRPGRPPQGPTRPPRSPGPRLRHVRLGSARPSTEDDDLTVTRPVSGAPEDPSPLPDPTSMCALVVRAAVEVLHGDRPAAQLARWVAPAVLDQLGTRARLLRDAGEAGVGSTRPVRVRRVRLEHHGDAVEAAVIVDDRDRVRAAAARLEVHRGQWRVSILEIG